VANRDLRRTWKTLAGKAGVPKEIVDRLQNHALQDVSSKHYDRWNYMVEKRAGVAKWDKFVAGSTVFARYETPAPNSTGKSCYNPPVKNLTSPVNRGSGPGR
jgi:hypothetical protein